VQRHPVLAALICLDVLDALSSPWSASLSPTASISSVTTTYKLSALFSADPLERCLSSAPTCHRRSPLRTYIMIFRDAASQGAARARERERGERYIVFRLPVHPTICPLVMIPPASNGPQTTSYLHNEPGPPGRRTPRAQPRRCGIPRFARRSTACRAQFKVANLQVQPAGETERSSARLAIAQQRQRSVLPVGGLASHAALLAPAAAQPSRPCA